MYLQGGGGGVTSRSACSDAGAGVCRTGGVVRRQLRQNRGCCNINKQARNDFLEAVSNNAKTPSFLGNKPSDSHKKSSTYL